MATLSKTNDVLALQPRVRYRAVGDDGVVVQLDNGRVLVVNEVGLRIVELLGEPRSKSALAARIAEEFEVTMEQAEADLEHFFEELDAEQVLATQAGDEAE